jgi:chromosome segregation ATPase
VNEVVSPSIATLRQEIEAMSTAHEAALQQKETDIEGWVALCQRQVEEKETVETNLAATKKSIEVLQQDQSVRVDKMSKLDEMAAAMSSELEQAKGGLEFADNTISNLEISLGKVTAERDEMKAVIAGIKVATSKQLKSLSIERDAALEHTIELETQLGSATDERDGSRSELEASHAKAVKLTAAIDGLEECAREASLRMKSLSEEKEAALADVTKFNPSLKTYTKGMMHWLQNRASCSLITIPLRCNWKTKVKHLSRLGLLSRTSSLPRTRRRRSSRISVERKNLLSHEQSSSRMSLTRRTTRSTPRDLTATSWMNSWQRKAKNSTRLYRNSRPAMVRSRN